MTWPHVTTCLKGYVNSWVEAPNGKSPPCHVWWPWSNASGDLRHLVCHVTIQHHATEGTLTM